MEDRLTFFVRAALTAPIVLVLAACGGPERSDAPTSAESAPASPTPEGTTAEPAAPAAPSGNQSQAAGSGAVAPDGAMSAISGSSDVAGGGSARFDESAPTANASGVTYAIDAATASSYAALVGDAAKGKRVFVKCIACHTVQEGQNRVGPSLYAIIGRPAGTVEKFKYSSANKDSGVVWTEDAMFRYLESPQKFFPGTLMTFPGLPAAQDRADIIAYLKSVSP